MKFLKILATIFCSLGLICYTSFIFDIGTDESNGDVGIFLFMDGLMILFLWLMWRKRSPKKKLKSDPASTAQDYVISASIQRSDVPDEVLSDMRASYTRDQAKNDFRILHDCLDLIEKTKNLETFFSRAELGMRTVLTLQQAEQAKIKGIVNTDPLVSSFFNAVSSSKQRVLLDSFEDEKTRIDGLKTPRGKLNGWEKYLELLKKYEDEFELDCPDDFNRINEYIQNQTLTLSLSLTK